MSPKKVSNNIHLFLLEGRSYFYLFAITITISFVCFFSTAKSSLIFLTLIAILIIGISNAVMMKILVSIAAHLHLIRIMKDGFLEATEDVLKMREK